MEPVFTPFKAFIFSMLNGKCDLVILYTQTLYI